METALIISIAILILGIIPLGIYLVKTLYREARVYEEESPLDDSMVPNRRKYVENWWENQRGIFNRGLFIAGATTGIGLWLVIGTQGSDLNRILLVVGIYIFLYILFMGLANLFYNSGLILETIYQPADPKAFRKKTFGYIFWIAVILPHAVPISILFKT